MTTFFVDTSSLAKRYVSEIGSKWVRTWTQPNNTDAILISDLTTVELVSLLLRRVREGTLPSEAEAKLESAFLFHVEHEYLVVHINLSVLDKSRTLLRKHGLRTLDSIQLACAVHAASLIKSPIMFVCSDNKLLAAARAEGFITDDRNLHA